MMTDKEIIALYFKRSENAIEQTDEKYGRLCHSISINILNDTRDSEECVNDTYLTLWNKIPPKEPNPFKAYICRIIKNLSLKKYEFNHAKKRNSAYETSLDELAEKKKSLNQVAHEMGTEIAIPFMFLSFICLAAIPAYAITDCGFIDVVNQKVIDPILGAVE